MNFNELSLPQAKKCSADSSLRAFPIDRIPKIDDEKPFTGIFNGLSVEISDSDVIKHLFSNGCFGLSTKTKNTPQSLFALPRMQNVSQCQYVQKFAWNANFTNRNPDLVMINLLAPAERSETNHLKHKSVEETSIDCENIGNEDERDDFEDNGDENIEDENTIDQTMENVLEKTEPMEISRKSEPEPNLVADPFPIEEYLALFPEEAFLLHYSLRCLKILNFEQTHEFTTEELLEKFCDMNPKFIERFIAYHYYRSKNWVVKGGLKFGGDFLLYYKGPSYYHASYVVLVNDSEDEVNQLDMQSNYRVSDSTKKELIIATITRPKNLEYSSRTECLNRLNEFQITEIIPKRLTINQLA
ncbi:tRNA-splicing endonuclease subunit Sen2 [Contarinia nasturtii]|uniref:tRNA-splicing endonuclease subunit Sen2 n=1 Tax=Contarinia nasturtii TaxID=265458 RepID=UPI0012D3E76B|nr:tRNA-splicing endonuclease subunit Sen2 [Contarinia nasturtii]